MSKERSSTEKQTSSNANKLIIHETKDKEQIANEICKSEMSSIFAKIVADKSKEYRFGKDSENFGDFCESEDENWIIDSYLNQFLPLSCSSFMRNQ